MNLEDAKIREKAARSHGRHIKLELELNAIGLSLFAPPFTEFREVKGNEWEGHFVPAHRTRLEEIISDIAFAVSEICTISTEEAVQEHCVIAANKLTELALFIKTVNAEETK